MYSQENVSLRKSFGRKWTSLRQNQSDLELNEEENSKSNNLKNSSHNNCGGESTSTSTITASPAPMDRSDGERNTKRKSNWEVIEHYGGNYGGNAVRESTFNIVVCSFKSLPASSQIINSITSF